MVRRERRDTLGKPDALRDPRRAECDDEEYGGKRVAIVPTEDVRAVL